MIRRNWSLADEVRKNEKKRQQKIQQRQKYDFQNQKLSKADPIGIYKRIRSIETSNSLEKQAKYLKTLKDDWDFILKNGLHKEKVDSYLSKIQHDEREALKAQRKLWGQKSVYFNPELNPQGKVPTLSLKPLPNTTIPLKDKITYAKDDVIDELDVVLPEGEPPRFYKIVVNTEKPQYNDISNNASTSIASAGMNSKNSQRKRRKFN